MCLDFHPPPPPPHQALNAYQNSLCTQRVCKDKRARKKEGGRGEEFLFP